VFDGLKARLDRLFADAARPGAREQVAALQEALIETKVAVRGMHEALEATERELAAERRQLEDAERRGRLAAAVPDPETVAVAERFAARHRERAAVLERKVAVQRDELALAERELEELHARFRGARLGASGAAGSASAEAAWRDLEAAGAAQPETDVDGELLKAQVDRAAYEAAVEAQLAYLKKKLGKQ
jgi:hypothetical protein